jgi:hypothetical protein
MPSFPSSVVRPTVAFRSAEKARSAVVPGLSTTSALVSLMNSSVMPATPSLTRSARSGMTPKGRNTSPTRAAKFCTSIDVAGISARSALSESCTFLPNAGPNTRLTRPAAASYSAASLPAPKSAPPIGSVRNCSNCWPADLRLCPALTIPSAILLEKLFAAISPARLNCESMSRIAVGVRMPLPSRSRRRSSSERLNAALAWLAARVNPLASSSPVVVLSFASAIARL